MTNFIVTDIVVRCSICLLFNEGRTRMYIPPNCHKSTTFFRHPTIFRTSFFDSFQYFFDYGITLSQSSSIANHRSLCTAPLRFHKPSLGRPHTSLHAFFARTRISCYRRALSLPHLPQVPQNSDFLRLTDGRNTDRLPQTLLLRCSKEPLNMDGMFLKWKRSWGFPSTS